MRRLLSTAMFAVLLVLPGVAASSPRTAGGEAPYTFAVMGDSRGGDRLFVQVVERVMRRKPAFVVHTGDMIAGAMNHQHWQHFRDLTNPITVPLYLAPGNHDIEDARSQQVWRDEVELPGAETHYSFTRGPDLFVVLNSNEPANEQRIAGEQLAWLMRTLDPATYRHQFVFLHHPLFLWKGAAHYNDALDRHPAERDALHRLFAERGVDIVFSGHEHVYRRLNKGGVTYIIGGGAGQPLYEKGTSMSFHHYLFLRVDGPRVSGEVFDPEGALHDAFTLTKGR